MGVVTQENPSYWGTFPPEHAVQTGLVQVVQEASMVEQALQVPGPLSRYYPAAHVLHQV